MKTPEEAYDIKIASDPDIHGDFVYFTLNWIEGDDYASAIYRFGGHGIERVTYGNHEKNPKFHGNSLYYLSYEKDREKLVCIDGTKEPREVYSNSSISRFVFHGDSVLAVVSDPSDEKEPFVTSRLKYRFDSRGLLRRRNKLVRIGEKPETLVEGDFDVSDVSTNGERVVFTASMETDDYEMADVYDLDLSTGKYRKITSGRGTVSTVCVAEDGTVAYTGHREGLRPWARDRLIFPELEKAVDVGMNTGNDVGSDMFAGDNLNLVNDGGKYYMIAQDGGSSAVYSYDGNSEKLTPENISVLDFTSEGGKLAYIYSSHEKPCTISFGGEHDFNPGVRGRIPEHITKDGKEAWLIMSGKDRPTVLSVHGGPHGTYGYAYFIEFNYLADNGYNVLFGNPRGSSGYGEDFSRQCIGDWGGKDLQDLLGLLDAAIEKHSLSDVAAITGGSYGGYMTNAAITKTGRFRCGIAERCVSNLFSMCGTSDIGFWFNAIESDAEDPWSEEGMRKLREMSPVSHIKNVHTPTMFIHGEEDYRCPIEQSEQMYTGLKMNGIDTVLVRYPGDSHEHARRGVPRNMRDRLKRKLDWFNRYCTG